MFVLKNERELAIMRKAGSISARALQIAGESIKPGISTWDIDKIIFDTIKSYDAIPSFLGYGGFPASACISINDEVIHGIPSKTRIIQEGDIVSVDVGACYNGFHGDNAATFAAGTVSQKAQDLIRITRESLEKAVSVAIVGNRIGDISHAVQSHVESFGYSVVKTFVGHGIGSKLHESPEVPNYGTPGRGERLLPGMTIAIEPMINIGTPQVKVLPDKWTVKTTDGSLSAHFEYTIAITEQGPVILTLP